MLGIPLIMSSSASVSVNSASPSLGTWSQENNGVGFVVAIGGALKLTFISPKTKQAPLTASIL